jgi:hypothetical protein
MTTEQTPRDARAAMPGGAARAESPGDLPETPRLPRPHQPRSKEGSN